MPVRGIYTMREYLIREWNEAARELSFDGSSLEDFEQWHQQLSEKLAECMGVTPDFDDVTCEEIDSEDCGEFMRRKIEVRTEKNWWVSAYLLIPKDATQQSPQPAILCAHGHGEHGKDAVAGVTFGDKARIDSIRFHNYNYGEQMARQGYVTLVPDWRSFGEHANYDQNPYGGRDKCNIHFLTSLLMGKVLLTLNTWDGWKMLDLLQGMPEVRADALGCMGLSFGGTMTTYISATDERVKAADVICYCTLAMHYALRNANCCGSQMLPGLYRYCDLPDVLGLIAPRPLLIEIGKRDSCFHYGPAMEALEQVKKIYRAAGARDDLHTDIFDGEHAYSGVVAPNFFAKYLRGEGLEV